MPPASRRKDRSIQRGPYPPENAIFFLWHLASLIYLVCYFADLDIAAKLRSSLTRDTLDNSHVYAVLAALIFCYYLTTKIYDVYFGPLSQIPGPKLWAASPIPTIYHMMNGEMHLDTYRLHEKYGPVVRTGPRYVSFLGNAQAWNNMHGFKQMGQLKPFKDPHGDKFEGPTGVDSVITADDANGNENVRASTKRYDTYFCYQHSRMRKVLAHAFSERALKEQEPILRHWAQKLIDACAEKAKAGQPADMVKFYNCTTFDVMADLTFGEGLGMLANEEYPPWVKAIFDNLKLAVRMTAIKMIHPSIRWFMNTFVEGGELMRKKRQEHFYFATEKLDRRLARKPDRPDFWSRIQARENESDAFSLDEQRENAALFMVAGTETSASALSGTTYYLLRNPECTRKLAHELRSKFTSLEELNLTQLAQCHYLQAVLQEGLRVYPPSPVAMPRTTPPGGCKIDGTWVPEGVVVGIPYPATNWSPNNFHLPLEFHPERWLPDRPDEFKNDKWDAFEPFSTGPRNCLGQDLAWHKMRLVIAAVVLYFDLELCEGMENWNDQKVYGLWEKPPLMCNLTPAKK